MEEFDKRPLEICPICLRKLYANIIMKDSKDLFMSRVNSPLILYDRFVRLADVLEENFGSLFENEVKWYRKRVIALNSII
jgi:hypothetical protein